MTAEYDDSRVGSQHCDLIVHNAYLITVNAERIIYSDGAVAVQGRRIAAVGPSREVRAQWSAIHEIDAQGAVVHPGFCETHMHVSIHVGRSGVAEPVTWDSQQNFYSNLWNAMDDEDEYLSTQLACLELASYGATAFLECGTVLEPDSAARAAESVGIRAVLGDPFLWDEGGFGGRGDVSPPVHRAPADKKRALDLLGGQLHRNTDPTALVQGHVAIIGMATCSDELTLAAKALAREHGVVLNQHQSYGGDDARDDDERFGKHPLVHYREMEILDDHTTFAHMNVLRDDEVDAMTNTGMSVAWCPLASAMYGVGATCSGRHYELTKRGVNVAVGSDSPNYTGRFDTGAQAFAAILASREQSLSADALYAEDGLVMATINGARALGLADRVGSIEPGKLADLVIRQTNTIETTPHNDRVQNLIYSSRSTRAQTVIVNGEVILRHGVSTKVDTERVLFQAAEASRNVVKKMGYNIAPRWPVIP